MGTMSFLSTGGSFLSPVKSQFLKNIFLALLPLLPSIFKNVNRNIKWREEAESQGQA